MKKRKKKIKEIKESCIAERDWWEQEVQALERDILLIKAKAFDLLAERG